MSDNEELSRLSRLTAILTLLQSKKIITATFIAEKFNISVRTVYRDIKALIEAGVPIFTEEGKGYSLMEGYRIPPVMFTETEANALITAEQLIIKNKDISFVNSYIDAIVKIKAILKYTLKDKTEILSNRIHFRVNPENQFTSNHLSIIQLAITNFNLVKIKYQAEDNLTTTRTIEPLGLYSTQENWILIAYCHLRKANRAFRLDRIKALDVLNETFPSRDFDLKTYFESYKKEI